MNEMKTPSSSSRSDTKSGAPIFGADEAENVSQRAEYVSDAVASRAETFKSGMGYPAAEVHAYIRKRAQGKSVSKPKAKHWKR
jgi:hypothetical protein